MVDRDEPVVAVTRVLTEARTDEIENGQSYSEDDEYGNHSDLLSLAVHSLQPPIPNHIPYLTDSFYRE